jgi:hypothetical protein
MTLSDTQTQTPTGNAAATPGTTAAPDAGAGSPAAPASTLAGAPPEKQQASKEGGTGNQTVNGEPAKATQATTPDVEIRLPEGFEADADVLKGFKASAKEFGLKSEQAQKFADYFVQAQTAFQTRQQQAVTQRIQEWGKAVETDKDLGGAKLPETLMHARKAVEFAGGEPLRQLLNQTGLGNHPVLVRAFCAFGKAMADDSIATANSQPPTQPSQEDMLRRMYPSNFKDG